MIRLLKAFADWLDRRFPAKVTMTEETWNAINRRIGLLERRSADTSDMFAGFRQSMTEYIALTDGEIGRLTQSIAILKKQKEEAKPVTNPKRTFIETGDISLLK